MNKKSGRWIRVALFAAATIFSLPAWSGGKTAPEWIEIDAVTQATSRYEAMRFNHGGHTDKLGIDCSKCHHTWERELMESPTRCVACHGYKAEVSLLKAFHGTCRGCHLDNRAGPVKCLGCHSEKK